MTARYLLPATLGGALAVGHLATRIPARFKVLLLCGLVGSYCLSSYPMLKTALMGRLKAERARSTQLLTPEQFASWPADLPLVVGSGIDYLPFAHYAASGVRERSLTLVDPAAARSYVETDSVTLYLQDAQGRQDFLDEIAGSTPLRALGAPDEVASLVAWLCSREADWMQGQVLYLDGGIFLHAPGHSVRWWKKTGRL